MKIRSTFFAIALSIMLMSTNIIAQSIAWTETRPVGDVNQAWVTTSMSSDGTTLIAGVWNGRLYISTNSGDAWTETRPAGDAAKNWFISSTSSDGTKMIAGVNGGRIYCSTNSGSTWTETQPAGDADKSWTATSMSSDGTKLIAGTFNGRIYYSINSGTAWTETQPAGVVDKGWYTTSMSSDGTKLLAGAYPGRLYYSVNSGTVWTETQPAGPADLNWQATSMSSDGTKLIAGSFPNQFNPVGRLYLSANSGTSWTETQPGGDNHLGWVTAKMSSDGTKMIAGVFNSSLFVSSNGGSNWTVTQPNSSGANVWQSASISSDATKLMAGVNGGRLYLNIGLLPVELSSFTASVVKSDVMLQWSTATEMNNYGFDVERRTTSLMSSPNYGGNAAGGWQKIGFAAGHGTSNSPQHYSYADRLSAGTYAYRLKQIDRDGKFEYSQTVEVSAAITPKEFGLEQNYPNPFNPTTMLNYQLTMNSQVSLKIYDAIGREVATLVNEVKDAGTYSAQFDGARLSSGIYFAKLTSDSKTQIRKLMLIK